MAYLTHQIGDFQFVTLLAPSGQPMPPMMQINRVSRPGVNGSDYSKEGTKGTPFQLISMVDTATLDEAHALPTQYMTTIDEGAVELIKDGHNYTADGWQVKVLAVRPLDIRRIISGGGNFLNPPSHGWLVCLWDLEAVSLD